ncbi:MAG: nuclear transport factor 2 family protein [Chloroflexi bacterium]|nr:nuclear transport factor 2 family protein [Chloroflexota bacterium]
MDHDARLATLRAIAAAFDRHDLDAIMEHFADDAVFESPRGPDRWGRRFTGLAEIRGAFAARFAGIPDVRYTADEHFIDDDRGASEWRLTGTTTDGQSLDLQGCDLWAFRGDKVVRKDSYWKLVTD